MIAFKNWPILRPIQERERENSSITNYETEITFLFVSNF